VELTPTAAAFLRNAFSTADRDLDGVLSPSEQDELFSTAPSKCAVCWKPSRPGSKHTQGGGFYGRFAGGDVSLSVGRCLRVGGLRPECVLPRHVKLIGTRRRHCHLPRAMHRWYAPARCCSPWADSEFEGVMVESRSGGLTANGFLAKWAVMAAAAPRKTLAHLLYLGYEEDPGALFHIGRPRRQERKADQPARGVYQVRALVVVPDARVYCDRGCVLLKWLRQCSMCNGARMLNEIQMYAKGAVSM